MKIIRIKQSNIVVVFENLDHSTLDANEVRKILKYSKSEALSVIEAPGLKAFIAPRDKTAIIFEQNRLKVNDDSGKKVEDSKITNLFSALRTNLKGKEVAFGFNYTLIIEYDSLTATRKLGSTIFNKQEGIELVKGGYQLSYKRSGKNFRIGLNPTEIKDRGILTLNSHYESIPAKYSLNFIKDYKEISKILANIK